MASPRNRRTIQIARADEHQVGEISRLCLEFMRFYQGIEPFFELREGAVAGYEDQVQRVMKSKDGLVLVAVDGGWVVGFSLSGYQGSHTSTAL